MKQDPKSEQMTGAEFVRQQPALARVLADMARRAVVQQNESAKGSVDQAEKLEVELKQARAESAAKMARDL